MDARFKKEGCCFEMSGFCFEIVALSFRNRINAFRNRNVLPWRTIDGTIRSIWMGRRAEEPVEKPGQADVEVGRRVCQMRFRAKLSQRDLADLLGTTEREIVSWESGTSVIYSDELLRLAVALHTTPNVLLGWPS